MNYSKRYYFTHPWKLVKECVHYAHCFFQRGSRGYSEDDVINLDHYLSSWLPKALRGLKESDSYPSSFDGWCNEMTPKRWKKLLEQMAHGFEEIRVGGTGKKFINKWVKEDTKKRKGREVFAFWFWSLWS